MSIDGTHPTQSDKARVIYPVTFFKNGSDDPSTDFRPKVVPANTPDEEEEPAPKAESVPEPVESSESPTVTVVTESPAPTPAVKVSGPPKVTKPGPQTS